MGDTNSLHPGIDLDIICINELISKKENGTPKSNGSGHPAGIVRTNPDDYRVFVNDIFRKMKGREAFLSFSRQITNVNQILNMVYSSAGDIARVILKDLALTAQVLKLVNSSFYRQFSEKGIATISEAMIILGTDEIRQVAAGLKVFEMMKNMANSEILKKKTLKGLQRSFMARQISRERENSTTDALQISAMVYDLGEYMVALFDADTYVRVEIAMEEKRLSRGDAAKSIFGLTYSDLGRIIALKLNLPQEVVQAMRPVTQIPPKPVSLSEKEQARYLCAFIHELSILPLEGEDEHSHGGASALTDKYHNVLGIDLEKALDMIQMSSEKMVRHAKLLGLDSGVTKKADTDAGIKNKDNLDQNVTLVDQALNEKLSIHDIFTRLVDTMDKCFYFNQVIISIKKKETNTMEPRFIRGEKRSKAVTRSLAFKIKSTPDVFNNAIGRKTDMIVRDTVKEAYKMQIPSWYVNKVAKSQHIKGFAIFPVFVDKKIISMIYVDWDEKAPALTQNIVEYLQGFREQMIKTFTLHYR